MRLDSKNSAAAQGFEITVDGAPVNVADPALTLLDVVRETAGVRSVKDGCSPQGQCGCCTVLVDGRARVACVTPARRVRGRDVRTIDGLPTAERDRWARAFDAVGGSQCGFCTPGIICRFSALAARGADHRDRAAAARALAAHLCRCTGWQPIIDAWTAYGDLAEADLAEAESAVASDAGSDTDIEQTGVPRLRSAVRRGRGGRDPIEPPKAVPRLRSTVRNRPSRADADLRALIEGRSLQTTGRRTALGQGGFADDTAPDDALVAVLAGDGTGWVVAKTASEARRAAGAVPGRRTTASWGPPLEAPAGDWAATLRTSWVEPGYLETDAAWCLPGGEPASPLGNGGAFGAKRDSPVAAAARSLANEHGRAVRVLWSRPEATALGSKRPPLAAGIRPDGSGEVVVARTPGIAEAIIGYAPGLTVREIDLPGPPTSAALRAAGWAEAAALTAAAAAAGRPGWVTAPEGGAARASVGDDGTIHVSVRAGRPLAETVLRSYCTGAAHMALSWVTSESLGVAPDTGVVHDLTVRSFGIIGAAAMPRVDVEIVPEDRRPVNGSDAVFAAVAAAVWLHQGTPPLWPTGIALA